MRLAATVLHDLRFQFRHGFYHIYLIFAAMYIAGIRFLPASVAPTAGVLVVFSDPAMLGLFFVGGISFLERDQGVLDSLFVTPLRVREYMAAKVLSLLVISLLTGVAVIVGAFGFSARYVPLIIGLVLASPLFTLTGMALSTRARTIIGLIAYAPPVIIIMTLLPMVQYLGWISSPVSWLLPGMPSLMLMGGTFSPLTAGMWAYGAGVSIAWIAVAWWWAERCLIHHVIEKVGR